jgi:hypothetical protein
MNDHDLWGRNRYDGRKGILEMKKPPGEDAWRSLSLRTGGRDRDTGSKDKVRQGWSLATLPGVAEVPLPSAGFLAKPVTCNNSVLNACVYSGVSPSQLYHGGQAQQAARAHTVRQWPPHCLALGPHLYMMSWTSKSKRGGI